MAFAGGSPLAALLAARQGQGAPPQPNMNQTDAGPDKASDLVNQASQILQRALAVENDPVEKEGIAKIVALLHGFSAREQKQRDAAMGAGPAVQMLRRQNQG
jgi:hypothetical protein